MACLPQFDTMHPSISLGAFFNDRTYPTKLNYTSGTDSVTVDASELR